MKGGWPLHTGVLRDAILQGLQEPSCCVALKTPSISELARAMGMGSQEPSVCDHSFTDERSTFAGLVGISAPSLARPCLPLLSTLPGPDFCSLR